MKKIMVYLGLVQGPPPVCGNYNMLFSLSFGGWGLSSALGRAFQVGLVVLVEFWLGVYGELSKLWSLFGSPRLGPVLGPALK